MQYLVTCSEQEERFDSFIFVFLQILSLQNLVRLLKNHASGFCSKGSQNELHSALIYVECLK